MRPDLIVTQALCDVCAVAESEVTAAACRLSSRPQVVNLEPTNLANVLDGLRIVGEAADAAERARAAIARLQARVALVTERTERIADRPRVVLLEWIAPVFSSGHWSPELVRLAGGAEMIGRDGQPSRSVPWDDVRRADPEALIIACCGFDAVCARRDVPLLAGCPGFDDLSCVRSQRVFVVDGSAYFSRPGPRLVDSLEILAYALHPRAHPLPKGLPPAQRLTHAELSRAAAAGRGDATP